MQAAPASALLSRLSNKRVQLLKHSRKGSQHMVEQTSDLKLHRCHVRNRLQQNRKHKLQSNLLKRLNKGCKSKEYQQVCSIMDTSSGMPTGSVNFAVRLAHVVRTVPLMCHETLLDCIAASCGICEHNLHAETPLSDPRHPNLRIKSGHHCSE